MLRYNIGLEQLCKDTLSLRGIQLAAAKIKQLVGLDGDPHWIMEVAFGGRVLVQSLWVVQ